MRNLPKGVDNSLSLQNAVYSHISIEKDTSLFSLLYDIVLNQPIQCNASKLAKERTSPDELQEEHLEAVKELFEESRSNDSGCPSEDKMLVTEVIAEKVSEKEEVIIEECSENEERKSEYERLELETNAAIEEFKDSLQELLDSGNLDVSALQNQVMGVVESDIGRNIVEEEPEVAFHYFKNGALLGDPSSTFNLGLCYHLGKGTKQNLAKARELYEAAARVNHGWATYNLAVLMGKGEGGSQDQVYARALLQKAAHLGVGEAKDALRKLKEEEEETLSVIHQTQSAPVFQGHSEEHRHSSYSMSDLLFLSSEETDEQFAHGSELIQKDESTDIKFYLPS
ncbi:uncharacterized protein LOC143034625 [Oratosquilla oratoria]|uniref:uncharacterized protein LOC143034625 n=1 Tax=Oratosquilla oratoria TaxID=337810 RepID=UPI003F774873